MDFPTNINLCRQREFSEQGYIQDIYCSFQMFHIGNERTSLRFVTDSPTFLEVYGYFRAIQLTQ